MIVTCLYASVGIIAVLLFIWFSIVSISEKKPRAAVIGLFFAGIIAAGWYAGLVVSVQTTAIQAAVSGAALLAAALFFLPVGRTHRMVSEPSGERVDERDTMFARDDYRPGMREYDEYYAMRPENKAIDDRIRELPDLCKPGGRYYDRLRSGYIDSLFAVEDRLKHLTDGQPSPDRVHLPPEEASRLLKEMARHLGADETGVAALNPAFVYSHVGRGPDEWGSEIHTTHTHAVMFTVEMKIGKVDEAPRTGITEESAIRYLDGQKISIALAQYIRDLGWSARAHVAGSDYKIIMPAVAHAAGLGEIGRLGYLISPRFGARIRLGGVTTDMPLAADEPICFGVQDFCGICKKCAVNCPSRSIPIEGKTNVRGTEKWPLRIESCFQYWKHIGTDCGLCMRVCPFSHPDTFVHNVLRAGIKRSAFARRLAVHLDDLFYGRKTAFPRYTDDEQK